MGSFRKKIKRRTTLRMRWGKGKDRTFGMKIKGGAHFYFDSEGVYSTVEWERTRFAIGGGDLKHF